MESSPAECHRSGARCHKFVDRQEGGGLVFNYNYRQNRNYGSVHEGTDYLTCMVISGVVKYLIFPKFASGGNQPFVAYVLPLMVLVPTIMFDDGAYTYLSESLYWKNWEWDLSAVQIVSVKVNGALGWVAIKVKFPSSDPGQYGKKTIRTTVGRAQDFLRYCRR